MRRARRACLFSDILPRCGRKLRRTLYFALLVSFCKTVRAPKMAAFRESLREFLRAARRYEPSSRNAWGVDMRVNTAILLKTVSYHTLGCALWLSLGHSVQAGGNEFCLEQSSGILAFGYCTGQGFSGAALASQALTELSQTTRSKTPGARRRKLGTGERKKRNVARKVLRRWKGSASRLRRRSRKR